MYLGCKQLVNSTDTNALLLVQAHVSPIGKGSFTQSLSCGAWQIVFMTALRRAAEQNDGCLQADCWAVSPVNRC